MAKKKAKGKAKEQPPAKPLSAPRAKKEQAQPLAWIRGLSETPDRGEVWTPLYCFRWPGQSLEARATLKHILDLDVLPREIADFEDFDLQLPEGVTPESPDSAPEASQKASEPLSAPVLRPKRQKAVQSASEDGQKRQKRCREVYDATPRFRCIRRRKHEGTHRDLSGHVWEDED